jgi:hypothetical protein
MDRLFCSVPKEVGEWLKQLAVDERTTSSEILRRIVVGIFDDQLLNAEHLGANAPYDSVGEALGGVVGDIDLIFQEELWETRIPSFPMRPYYQWLASGLPGAMKKVKLFTDREARQDEGQEKERFWKRLAGKSSNEDEDDDGWDE